MTAEIRRIIEDAKAKGRYEQMLDAAREYAQIPMEEREEHCYLTTPKQREILRGVIEFESLRFFKN